MNVKCCNACIVDPMCTVGCKELWIYYKLLKQKSSKYFKIMKICVNSMIVFSVGHGLMLATGFSVRTGSGNYYEIEYLGLTYWYWWFIVIYMASVVAYLYFMVRRTLTQKIISKIDVSRRSSFISHKHFQEALEKNRHRHGGGTTI